VVNHVSVSVKQGEIVGLLGPNGAGKTTSFYMVVGLIKPDVGDVFLNDINITKLPMYKRAQMGIGYLPQEASVFRKLTVENNIMAVLEMTKLTKAERRHKLEELLDEFHLHHVRKNNGDSLSGGERRRTEIARALAVDPKFILLDEPFAGVDPIAVEDIQSVVARLKYKNIGILITDHNVNETLSICDRAYLLIDGKIFQHGTAEELAENEQVRRLYLGTNFELKRKDWIIEMGMKDESISSMVRALDSLHQHAEKILVEDLSSLTDITPTHVKLEDLKVDEFVSLYNSTKKHLQKWVTSITGTDLQDLINALPDISADDFSQPSFFLLYDLVNNAHLNEHATEIASHFKYEETNGKLQKLTSHVGAIKTRLKALAN
jgi:lipopolysaccharide export system ATP-binding protein